MAQPIADALNNPYITIAIVGVIIVISVGLRLYMMHRGNMRAKCPKCGAVFDASRSFSGIHIGPLRTLQCPACGKTSLMNSYSKAPLTWPPQTSAPEQPTLSEEELERKHIEESKYERS
jgi:uncharacterized C2H2 Zn-finger protein